MESKVLANGLAKTFIDSHYGKIDAKQSIEDLSVILLLFDKHKTIKEDFSYFKEYNVNIKRKRGRPRNVFTEIIDIPQKEAKPTSLREQIIQEGKRCKGRKALAARLGMTERTLYRKIKELKIK